jgi:hypothetical protein
MSHWHDHFDPHLLLISSQRYCIGRTSYIVGWWCESLIRAWPSVPENTKEILKRDLREAIEDDDRARADGETYLPLGHKCDRKAWEALWQRMRQE